MPGAHAVLGSNPSPPATDKPRPFWMIYFVLKVNGDLSTREARRLVWDFDKFKTPERPID
jgi:hypothetical protein